MEKFREPRASLTFSAREGSAFKKIFRMVRFTLFCFFLSLLQVMAVDSYSQTRLSLNHQNQKLENVLKTIEDKSEFFFLYNRDLINVDQTVNINIKDQTITVILDELLKGTDIKYSVVNRQIILSNLEGVSGLNSQQQKSVSGQVTDNSGAGLPGVSVVIKGTTTGVITDMDGKYTLSKIPDSATLQFSFVGMKTQEVAVGSKTSINVILAEDIVGIEEVVAIGYGTVAKRNLTGAVNSIKKEEIVKSPAGNVMEAIQGKIPGVDIIRSSGGAGSGTSISVRGNRSINAGNNPLYIVDGIQYNNIQDVNPNDILSMDILKDASSTAIYGSRGANGVVIITTKRGTEGRVKVTAGFYSGVSTLAGYPKPMNGTQFANLIREGYRTNGVWNSTEDDSKIFTPSEISLINANTNTDWQDLMLHKGSQQDYNIGISGGTDKTKVFTSFDYYKEEGILKNDYSNRYSFRVSVDQTILKNFNIGVESQLAIYRQNLREDGVLNMTSKISPFYSPYNADGSLALYPGEGFQSNPLFNDKSGTYVNEYIITRLLSIAYAEWKPLKGLMVRSNLGIVNASTRNGVFEGAKTIDRTASNGSSSAINNASQTDLTWENIVTYQNIFGDHSLNLTAVTSYLSNRSESSSASGTGQLLETNSFHALHNNPSNLAISSNYVGSNLMSGVFRMSYSYKEKYLLSFTGREDGASVLAPKNRWAFFPSGAVAWRVVNEKFMDNLNIISDLKLRGSIGLAGNSAVNPYQTQSRLQIIPFSWNDQQVLAYGLHPQLGNEDLTWELTTTQNIGIDFGFLKSRISGSVDIYRSKTKDLLFLQQLPTTTGGTSILTNIGKTKNSGIEIAVQTKNIQNHNFSWSSNIIYTKNKEEIVSLPNGSDIQNNLIIGSPIHSFYDYDKIGIWQTSDAALAASYGYKPGDIRVRDVNNDGKITATDDRIVVGSQVPRFNFGFSNDFKYKGIDLNVFVDCRIGQTINSLYAASYNPDAIENGVVADYWTPENSTNEYPRPDSKVSKSGLPFASTLGYKDGSFVKIRNITIGYTIPSTLAKKFHVASVRWYATAKNQFTFSKVKDYDPEGNGNQEQPVTKLLVTGINIEF